MPVIGHTGEELEQRVLDKSSEFRQLSRLKLQARIVLLNSLADYVPCAAHSLNLVGVPNVNCSIC